MGAATAPTAAVVAIGRLANASDALIKTCGPFVILLPGIRFINDDTAVLPQLIESRPSIF